MGKEQKQWVEQLRREQLKNSARNPGMAALMSFFMMGLGQIYAGHVDRGIILLAIHLSGIFTAFSLYSKGLIYESLFPILGMKILMIFIYIFSVFLILLWIYNIKDAYYLSLFSSFRDWFEVERVLLPVLQKQADALLANGASSTLNYITDGSVGVAGQFNSSADDSGEDFDDDFEELEVVSVSEKSSENAKKPESEKGTGESESIAAKKKSEEVKPDNKEEKLTDRAQSVKVNKPKISSKAEEVVFYSDIGSVSVERNSWKIYIGFCLIFLLLGLWLNKKDDARLGTLKNEEVLFNVSADLPGEKSSQRNFVVDQNNDQSPVQTPKELRPAPKEKLEPEIVVNSPFSEGLELMRKGNFESAAQSFELDLRRARPTRGIWKKILSSYYRADLTVKYEMVLRDYLKSYSDDSEEWFNLGKLLYDRDELSQASQAIVKGLRIAPENVRGNFLLGSIYKELGLDEDASTYLKRAVAMEPLNLDFNRELSSILLSLGKKEEAAKFAKRVLSLKPEDRVALDLMKSIEGSRNNNFVRPSKIDSNDVVFVQGRAKTVILQQTGDPGPSEEPVSKTKPKGKVLFNSGEVVESIDSIPQDSSEIDNSKKEQVINAKSKGKVLFEAPDSSLKANVIDEEQESTLKEEIVAQNERHVIPAYSESHSNPDKSKKEKVDRKSEKLAVKEAETKIKLDKNAGISLLEIQSSKSLTSSDEVLMMNSVAVEGKRSNPAPDSPDLKARTLELKNLGFSEYSQGHWEASLSHYLKYLETEKDREVYAVVGSIFEKLGMKNDGFDAYEQAYKLGDKSPGTLIKLGRIAESLKKYKKGEYYLYHALKASPHRIDLRIRYARCMAANGRVEQAKRELEKVLEIDNISYAVGQRIRKELKLMNQEFSEGAK